MQYLRDYFSTPLAPNSINPGAIAYPRPTLCNCGGVWFRFVVVDSQKIANFENTHPLKLRVMVK
jgi:hypothetical protein